MSSLAAILALFVILSPFATSSTAAAGDDDSRSAYDIIQDFDFPMGLLPKGVTGYELDRSNGQFRAYLNGSCSFALEGSYQLKYKSTISGSISKNKLSGLTGVSVKVLFLWLDIVEVTRSGDNLEFSVGIASAAFPIDNFYECPQCGCGLDCVNGQICGLVVCKLCWRKLCSPCPACEFGTMYGWPDNRCCLSCSTLLSSWNESI